MKLFAAGLFTETNTFSPILAGIDDVHVTDADDLKNGVPPSDMHPFSVWHKKSIARGDQFHFGLFAWAQPAGLTTATTYETVRDEILSALAASGPIDLVLLFLHGAMVAQGYEDCEGDLLTRIRQQLGPDVTIAVELDLHCHLTQNIIDKADIVITFKEYPHVDVNARAEELFDLAVAASAGHIQPTMALYDCKMVGMYPTSTPAMRGFIDSMVAVEQMEEVLSVSFIHGFPYGDVPDAGGKLLVVTHNNQPLAEQLAQTLGQQVFSLREQITFQSLPTEEAFAKALSIAAQSDNRLNKPLVVADQSDNAGAGAPADATFALQWLLAHQVQDAAIATFYDPQVVKLALAAGEGELFQVRLGGKLGVTSGDPLDLSVKVHKIQRDYLHQFPQENGDPGLMPLGDTVSLHCQGIDIIVSSDLCQCYSPCIFDALGIPASKKQLLVVKSTQHFYGAFAPIAREVIYMAAPGAVPPNVQQIPYQRMTTEDKYPWVADPFSEQQTQGY